MVRDVTEDDVAATHRLNEHSVPHVNSLPVETVAGFARSADYFRVASIDGSVVGFLIGLTHQAVYDSPNFRKFCEWFSDFVYVDRVVVSADARRLGVGKRLYEDFERYGRSCASRLTCEVNIRPLNAASLTFHRRMGFRQVGTQETEGGSKTVALLMKPL